MFAQLHSAFTCYLHTPSTHQAQGTCSPQQHLYLPELITNRVSAIKKKKIFFAHTSVKINLGTLRHWKITFLFVFFVFLSRKRGRHFPWAEMTSMWRGPRNLWISKWCYIRGSDPGRTGKAHKKWRFGGAGLTAKPSPTSR